MHCFVADGEDEPEEAAKDGSFDRAIMPEYVFNLEGNDEFLRHRVMNLPESVVHGTHNTEDGLMRRLESYRSMNGDDETVLNYFDELEFHPHKLDVTKDESHMMKDTVEQMKKIIGAARNYGMILIHVSS